MIRRLRACTVVLVALAFASRALAGDPLNSTDRLRGPAASRPAHHELTIVPIVGGTTDIGIGGGAFMGYSLIAPHLEPFVWNVEAAAFVSFKDVDGTVKAPYQDAYVQLSIPRVFGKLSLDIRGSYSWESILNYQGIGNATSDVLPPGAPTSYFRYGRLHPTLAIQARFKLLDHVAAKVGAQYTQNWLQIEPGSKVAEDIPSVATHAAVLLFKYGLQWDTRDNQTSTHAGWFHTLDVKLSPGGSGMFPYRYGQTTLVVRVFIPIYKPYLTLAARVVGDVLVGDAPFYQLAMFDETYAIGSGTGVRGVPGQRYYGKIKAFANVELRAEVAHFRLLKKSAVVGIVGFFDTGRVWADTAYRPDLDGSDVGLKYGVGGGLRFQSGEAFVLRADVAWSPDARPIGAYLSAGQLF